MHQLIATLFSLLLSLCQHTSLTARPVETAELPGTVHALSYDNSGVMVLPDRYQLARSATDEGYAGNACSSCRRMDRSLSER